MTNGSTQDFRTMDELEKNPRAVVDQVHQTGRPVILTSEGKPDLVLVDAQTYERGLQIENLRDLLAEGEAARAAGKVRPFEDFEAELIRDGKIPS